MSSRLESPQAPISSRRRAKWAVVALALAGAGLAFAQLDRARALAAAGRSEEALAALERSGPIAGREAEAELLRGVVLLEAGRDQEAERVFRAMIERWPELPEAYNNLAVVQASSGRYEAAVETLLAALATHSSYHTAYDNLTRVYSRLAGEAYSRALAEGTQGELPAVDLLVLTDLSRDSGPTRVAETAPAPAEPPPSRPPAPSAPPERNEVIEPPVLDAVKAWAAAWSDQRVDDYLAAYSASFVPPNGLAPSAWRRQRRERLTSPRFIRVSLAFLGSRRISADRAQVEFVQSYESDRYADTVTKRLDLVREAGGWKIVSETVVP